MFDLAIHNWKNFPSSYPAHKLEWIIIDDSPDSTLKDVLPVGDKRIKYYWLQTTGKIGLGKKRNLGVEKSTGSMICFMDDDDYYYPYSIRARVVTLMKYATDIETDPIGCVGVNNLDIYDVQNEFSARMKKGKIISEASMCFLKSFWSERPFPDRMEQQSPLGEGYSFLDGRYNEVITIPSCFVILAITHGNNVTGENRSYTQFKDKERSQNALKLIDEESRDIILRWKKQI